ncbi:MAG: tRNA (N6-isopentenyl adenosine(37)-C2)-methylthiotransferase MiaB [Candidatus Zixiibacteriota bacterium]
MSLKSYKIITFGCQMNIADSGVLQSIMEANGYLASESEKEADIVILNTCSVRDKAETRVLGRLSELSQYKRLDSNKKIVVVGCMAQRLGQQLLEKAPYVDYVLGTDRLFDLPLYLQNGNSGTAVNTAFGEVEIDNVVPSRDSRFASFVTISRGCDNFCTYCIVPYVRGRERSYPIKTIVDQVKRLVDDGVLEITFLGQNVNSYQDGGKDFTALLHEVITNTNIKRIRFMTSHPKDMSDKLIELIGTEPKMMRHVHLPLQSGSDRILRKMGRAYTFEHYYSLVEKLHLTAPEISITTDLIVGFPGETEDEFQATLAAVRKVGFDSAFMFRYSPRLGTKAASMVDDIREEEKIRRLNILIDLQKEVAYNKNQGEIGRVHSVLVDDFSRRDERVLKGKTGGNKTILFVGEADLIGSIIDIRVKSADSWTLHGDMVG